MDLFAEAVSGALGIEVATLKTIIMLCGVGLTISMICGSYGLDLSPGFF